MRQLLPILPLFAVACLSHRVQVEVPAAPSLELGTSSVAVVAVDRACEEVANALVAELAELDGIHVDPAAPLQLHVYGCTARLGVPLVDVRQQADRAGNTTETRRVFVEGRSQAAVDVVSDGVVVARLVGAGRRTLVADTAAQLAERRGMARDLVLRVAIDLADQVRPVPRLAVRRTYPNAPAPSAAGLLDAAVQAELAGDLGKARELALAAHHERPGPRTETYLAELERRVR
jgi:hypothetical protein